MLEYKPSDCLPCAEELPDSDDTPVDNELQDLIPSLLKAVLALLWEKRWDWFFGVDMAIYYHAVTVWQSGVVIGNRIRDRKRKGNLSGNDAGVVVLVR
jgi:Uma2 family endonuclease